MRMGANHSFIHLNPLSNAGSQKEGRTLLKVQAPLGMIGPKGKGAASYVEHVKEHLLE